MAANPTTMNAIILRRRVLRSGGTCDGWPFMSEARPDRDYFLQTPRSEVHSKTCCWTSYSDNGMVEHMRLRNQRLDGQRQNRVRRPRLQQRKAKGGPYTFLRNEPTDFSMKNSIYPSVIQWVT